MLEDVKMKLGDSATEVFFGDPLWWSVLKNAAKEYPGSVAARIVMFEEVGLMGAVERIEQGFYWASNFGNLLRDFGYEIQDYPTCDSHTQWLAAIDKWIANGRVPSEHPGLFPDDSWPNSYGVADTLDQVKEYLRPFIEHPTRTFIVSMDKVVRNPENRGRGGGWRWHKWGPYIGTFEPQCEYLDDEEGIDQVLLFHVTELLQKR